MKYTDIPGLHKAADYSDTFVHEFYENNLPEGATSALDQHKAWYKALDTAFKRIQGGKHGIGYNGAGEDEDGIPANVYVDIAQQGVLPYQVWKERTEKGLSAGDVTQTADLVNPRTYYVTTEMPKHVFGDYISDASPEAIASIYKQSPQLKVLLSLAKRRAQLNKDSENIQPPPAISEMDAEFEALDKEENANKAVQKIRAKMSKLYNELWDAQEIGTDKAGIAALEAELAALDKKRDALEKPYVTRYQGLLDRYSKEVEKWNTAHQKIRQRIQQIDATKVPSDSIRLPLTVKLAILGAGLAGGVGLGWWFTRGQKWLENKLT